MARRITEDAPAQEEKVSESEGVNFRVVTENQLILNMLQEINAKLDLLLPKKE